MQGLDEVCYRGLFYLRWHPIPYACPGLTATPSPGQWLLHASQQPTQPVKACPWITVPTASMCSSHPGLHNIGWNTDVSGLCRVFSYTMLLVTWSQAQPQWHLTVTNCKCHQWSHIIQDMTPLNPLSVRHTNNLTRLADEPNPCKLLFQVACTTTLPLAHCNRLLMTVISI